MPNPPPLEAPEFPVRCLGEILENKAVSKVTWVMKIHAPTVAPAIRPGQFVNLRTSDNIVPLLRRPMSVHRLIRHGEVATGFAVLYDVVGPGTRNLAAMTKGHRIDFVGPLGNEISVPAGTKRAVLIAGGVGIGPIKIVAEEIQRRGVRDITVCYGARDSDHVVPNEDAAPQRLPAPPMHRRRLGRTQGARDPVHRGVARDPPHRRRDVRLRLRPDADVPGPPAAPDAPGRPRRGRDRGIHGLRLRRLLRLLAARRGRRREGGLQALLRGRVHLPLERLVLEGVEHAR